MRTMLTGNFSTNFLLSFFITYILSFDTGRCQFSRRSFDSPRGRQVSQVENRSSTLWNKRLNFRNADIINNRDVSSPRRHLNIPNSLQRDQISRAHVPYNTLNGNSRIQSQQYTQRDVSQGNNRMFGPRSQSFDNTDFRVNTHSMNLGNMQTDRFRGSSHERSTSQGSSRDNMAQAFPYRRETVSRGRPNSREDYMNLHQGRFPINNNRYTIESLPTDRAALRQPYHTTRETQQLPRRPMLSRQTRPPERTILSRMHSAVSPTRERSHPAGRSRGNYRPAIRAERNEVFQYRTSVRRTPQSAASRHLNSNEQERFTGYPAPSLSLPFEPLSLRYQGFKESKLADQQRIRSSRTTDVHNRNAEQNTDTLGSGTQSVVGADTENTSRNNRTFQAILPFRTNRPSMFSRRNTQPFGLYRVHQQNSRLGRFVPRTNMAGQSSNFIDRNVASSRTFMPVNHDHLFTRIGSTNRLFGQNGLNTNTQHRARVPDGLGHARSSFGRFGLASGSHVEGRNGRGNAVYQSNLPNSPLHELFGISKTGLENALKSDIQHVGQSTNVRNEQPGTNSVSLDNGYQWQLQRASSNKQNKDNLIADITKNLEIADKLGLMGIPRRNIQSSYQITPNSNINFGSLKSLSKLPDGFLTLAQKIAHQNTDRDDDKDLFDTDDDGFIDK